RSTVPATALKKGLVTSLITSPMVWATPIFRLRAPRWGSYCNSAIAWRTRWREAGLTGTVLLITAETVAIETPALRATSRMVAMGNPGQIPVAGLWAFWNYNLNV